MDHGAAWNFFAAFANLETLEKDLGSMASRSLGVRLGAWLAVASFAHACAPLPPQAAAAAGCNARIIVGFHARTEAPAIAALAMSHSLTLDVVERLLPDLYVLDLSAPGGDPACATAVEQLRADARVRSAELDARRAPHAG